MGLSYHGMQGSENNKISTLEYCGENYCQKFFSPLRGLNGFCIGWSKYFQIFMLLNKDKSISVLNKYFQTSDLNKIINLAEKISQNNKLSNNNNKYLKNYFKNINIDINNLNFNIDNVYFDYTDKTFREEGFRDDAKELDGYIHFEDNYNNGKIYGIYEDDKLIYIGQTVRDINKRFKEHMEESENLKDKLHIYLKENGDKKFSIRLIKNHPCTSKYELDAEEQRQIKKYKDEVVLYNTCYNTIKTNIVKK